MEDRMVRVKVDKLAGWQDILIVSQLQGCGVEGDFRCSKSIG